MVGDYENLVAPYGGLQFPSLEVARQDPNRILSYRERVFSKYAAYRRRLEARWSVNFQYLIDNQWLDLISVAQADAQSGRYSLRFLQDMQDGMPRPVTNILAPNIEIELATYNKRQFMPQPIATSGDPWAVDMAKRMKAVLRHRARVLDWDVKRQRAGLYLVAAGTSGFRTWWDQDFSDFEMLPSPFAMQCSACKQIVASDIFPAQLKDYARYNTDSLKSAPGDPLSLVLTHCPSCDAVGTLGQAQMNEGDQKKQDIFKRPLFVKVPRGNPQIEALDPFTLYPENGGVQVTFDGFKVMHSVTARSLDWIADRHPQFAGMIRPDSATEIIRRNPLLGEYASFVWYGPSIDSNIFTHHALYYEMVCLPCARMPKGALIRSCNNLILQAEPLIWSYKDQESGFEMHVPRVTYACGVWMERPGEFFGHGMIDRGRSLQNRLNGRDAQIVDIHERLANPHILAATDMNCGSPAWFDPQSPYSGRLLQYDRSVLAPDDKPMVFGGVSPPAGVWQERDRILSDARFIMGPAEIEQGMAPKNISTTSGLQLASENAEQRRGPREGMMDFMCRKSWDAVMRMEQAFRVSESSYEEEDPVSKRWRSEVYSRVMLASSFRLEIEKTAYVAESIYNREASREAQADGLYVVTKPADRKKLLEMRGLPTDINQDDNYQVDCANQKFIDFLRDGVVPPIDVTLDNPAIHYDVLSTLLLSDEGKRLGKEIGWSKIVPVLTDWQLLLQQRMMQDAMSRKAYGMWNDDATIKELYGQAKAEYTLTLQNWDQIAQNHEAATMAAKAAGRPLPPPLLPPVEPIVPVLLPRPLNLKVLTVWKELLEKVKIVAPPDDPLYGEKLERYLRFRALRESYGLMMQGIGVPPAITPPPPSGAEVGAGMGAGAAPAVPAGTGTAPVGGAPANPAAPPQPTNTATPGTSQATANATDAATKPQGA